MKKLSGILLFLLLAVAGFSQSSKLTVYYQFQNIEDGYDHNCKNQIFIDGKMVGESAEAPQSKSGSITVSVPKGMRDVRVVNLAYYEGQWEEHTIENNYSIDCLYEMTRSFNKPEKLYLVFDLDEGTSSSWQKPVKKAKKKKK
jgi:hypothetical protein